jgi:hypothetical protein
MFQDLPIFNELIVKQEGLNLKELFKFSNEISGSSDYNEDDGYFDQFIPLPQEFLDFYYSKFCKVLPEELKNNNLGVMDFELDFLHEDLPKELQEKYGYENLYDWCIANWGTVFSKNVELSNPDYNGLIITMLTEPTPPVSYILSISRKYWKLKFSLISTSFKHGYGPEISGYTIKNGIIRHHWIDRYKRPSEDGYMRNHRITVESHTKVKANIY